MSVDKYFGMMPTSKFTCIHFADVVILGETGVKLNDAIFGFVNGQRVGASVSRFFERHKKPVENALVIMKPNAGTTTHAGVFIRGRVLHLTEYGVHYQPLAIASIGYRTCHFYTCKTP